METEEEGEDARYCIVGDETEVEIAEEPLRVRFCPCLWVWVCVGIGRYTISIRCAGCV